MSRKWIIRIVAVMMAVLMALSVMFTVIGNMTAGAVTQSQIDNLKKQQQEIENRKKDIKSQINSYEYQQKSALDKKQVLDRQVDLAEQEISNINEQIETYTQLIAIKEDEVVQAQDKEDKQLELFKDRLRAMEEAGSISYLAVIFNANSFSDLLARIDIVEQISKSDEALYNELRAAKQATIEAKQALETAKADQEAQKASLEQKKIQLNEQIAEATALIKEINKDLEAAKDLYEKEVKAAQEIQNDINAKVKELERQQQQGGKTVVGTGKLIWPTPSCYIVTSQFGRRYHPIYKQYRMHYGIDIGAKYGAAILASDSGTVITSAYSSSYGNYIVISHGNGMTTLYAHMSSRLVKAGAKVSKGDTIGKCGSTGDSTGPHLHFEVSVNGTRVNPLQYFSGYTIRE
jgi:murein DD-endopeptidase MepM/ murein hydrolase activator NlpD